MSSLRVEAAAFAYDDAVPLLSDLSFQLPAGWTGLVGENGAGKTTLLRLLSGELRPTRGAVRVERGARVWLCAQKVEALEPATRAFAEEPSGAARKLQGQLKLVPSMLERWPTLSPGERKRWQLGAALAAEPEVLLLDEPTNHLDASGRALLLNALQGFRGVGVVVSHDRALLDALTTRTLRLTAEGARLFPLPYSAAREQWEQERESRLQARAQLKAEQAKAQRRVQAQREELARATRARSTKARMRNPHDSDARTLGAKNLAEWGQVSVSKSLSSAQRHEERVEERLSADELRKELGRSVFLGYAPCPRPLLLWGEGPKGPLAVNRDSRIWLSGANGSGKTTLLRKLLASAAGEPERLLFLPQELEENAQGLEEVKALPPEERGRVLSLVAALGVEVDRLLASESGSPGEARKLALALGMARHAWLLVLDEPTNHLDLPSIERLEAALRAFPGALLLVTHDEALARACTNERWHLE